jgi:hypothetical protein
MKIKLLSSSFFLISAQIIFAQGSLAPKYSNEFLQIGVGT